MLDIKFIRENKDLINDAGRKKQLDFKVDELLKIDDRRRELQADFEKRRAEQNAMNDKIAAAPPEEKQNFIEGMRRQKEYLKVLQKELEEVVKKWQLLMLRVPNIPDVSVPAGKDDSENREFRVEGEIAVTPEKFPQGIKNHIELMESFDMADFERGSKVAGFRGYFLKNEAVILNFALWQFVFDFFVKKGYRPMFVPSLVRRETLIGTGYLPQGEEDLYKTQDGDYLAGTGEVGVMGYYMDEVIPKEKLPLKIIAFSPCFRREAGSHGKDTKGLMRVHEFYKWEQVIICEASHTESVKYHEELLQNSEELMKLLKVPYHVVVNCTGDLGLGQVKKYDIEAWVPSEKKYRETHSISYFHDFQARRLNIKYKDVDGKTKFAHSLNGTAMPTPRPLISIIENNQQPDGSIAIPEVLQKYTGFNLISKNK